jgi:hypothetical protein
LIGSLSLLLTEYGHFTQVVWKGTKEVGIGIASAKNQSARKYKIELSQMKNTNRKVILYI